MKKRTKNPSSGRKGGMAKRRKKVLPLPQIGSIQDNSNTKIITNDPVGGIEIKKEK